MLTQERLRALLDYNPDSGVFTWKTDRNNNAKQGSVAGCVSKGNNYVSIYVDGKQYSGHRLAWLWVYGYFPKELDHINRNRSDNRICNLRSVSRQQNVLNRECKNYYYNKSAKKWIVELVREGTYKYVGCYDSEEEASNVARHSRAS